MRYLCVFLLSRFGSVSAAKAQQPTPAKNEHSEGVNIRGDQGMDFSHEKTTHHLYLLADGGAIEIHSNEHTDAASQEAIRQHLVMIAPTVSGTILHPGGRGSVDRVGRSART